MTPFRNNGHLLTNQIRFTKVLSSCRQIVKHSISLRKGQWRKLRLLNHSDDKDNHRSSCPAQLHSCPWWLWWKLFSWRWWWWQRWFQWMCTKSDCWLTLWLASTSTSLTYIFWLTSLAAIGWSFSCFFACFCTVAMERKGEWVSPMSLGTCNKFLPLKGYARMFLK